MSKHEMESDTYSVLFQSPVHNGLLATQLIIENNKCYHRKLSNNDVLESDIKSQWEENARLNTHLFNGTKFRYGGHKWEECAKILHLKLGITDYASLIGTNASKNAPKFQELGLIECGDPQIYLSDALGVGAVVETSDKHILLIHRSKNVGEAKGMIDVPGGHPEPKNLIGNITKECIDIDTLDPHRIKDELFCSILNEIHDEINIPLHALSSPLLMGIIGSTLNANRPTAEFHVTCSYPSHEVMSMYSAGCQPEKYETTGLMLIKTEELKDIHTKPWYTNLAPSAKGAIHLYNLIC